MTQDRNARAPALPGGPSGRETASSRPAAVAPGEELEQLRSALAASEERFRAAFQDSPIPMTITRIADGIVTDVNPAFEQQLGIPRATFVGRASSDVRFWVRPGQRAEFFAGLRGQGRVDGLEVELYRGGREVRRHLVSARITEFAGEPHVITWGVDVTDCRVAEAGLVAAERNFSQVLHESPVGISISRVRDGLILDMNDEFLRILGFTRDEVVGKTSEEVHLWTAADQRATIVREFREKGAFSPRPIRMRRKDGSVVAVLFSASALSSGGREPITIAWVMDLTDRLRFEERLLASEEKWRTLAENAPVTILTVDRAGRILTFSRSLVGRPAEAVVGESIHDFPVGEGERERSVAFLERVFAEGVPVTFEIDVRAPGGGRIRMSNVLAPLRTGGEITAAVGVGVDVTAQHQAVEALRESEQRFRDIVRSLGDWVWEVDRAGRLTYSSPQVEALLGFPAEEMLGRSPWDTCFPEERRSLLAGQNAMLRHPAPFRDREIWHRHRDGGKVCLSVSGVPVFDGGGALRGYRGVVHDVTERKREEEEHRRLEAEVEQARRVESLGVLAGGIAHDFNNLLTAILGNAELALGELPEGGARELVSQIQAAGQHAAELTRQMLAYAGRGHLTTTRVDLTTAVREMAQLLGASLPKKVTLELELADGLPAVEADPAQLRQVVMNLVINAADAIGDGEGRIAVRTLGSSSPDPFAADFSLGKLEGGRAVACVEIADSGAGIPPETLAKIFDPFFTTKFTGRGLGLAAVQGIVLRHGGTVAVRTAAGSGSVFRICFPALAPATAPPGAAAAAAPASPPAQGARWRSSGTVLLVDDEEPVRRMATRMLKAFGFEVLEAVDGRAAVAVAAAHPGLRAVLLDLTMPHLDGRETFRELRRLRADLPVVLCSGYDVLESADRFSGMDFSGFLQKPYRLDDLVRVLRRALAE
jgi:PAS domain S-box-containing protein